MVFRGYPSSQMLQKDGFLTHPPPISPQFSPPFSNNFGKEAQAPPSSTSGGKISPAILFIIVILAVIFFVSGLLHLLVRFLTKQPSSSSQSNRYPELSTSDALQRQLQQLFHLHDSGLDQAFIDALPVFLYKEIMGLKEPFDCAVCLCEFSDEDKLRLLPLCSHAFHINCIDTWLLSNSTCPLCRGTLFTPGLAIENPVFDTDLPVEEDGRVPQTGCESDFSSGEKPVEVEEGGEKKVYHVRLGKFKNVNNAGGTPSIEERGEAETSSSNLDARRCYSMGSFQYIVADSNLHVALNHARDVSCSLRLPRERGVGERRNVNFIDSSHEELNGKKLSGAWKGESFSVSKIWLWSKKGNYPGSSATDITSFNRGLPLTTRTPNS